MANIRQYIGARYTPKFMDTYSVTTQYEALSVVDDGFGTTYISGKPTPPGTPLTDRNYWHLYGASSGAIINLQNQIDVIDANIDQIENLMTHGEIICVSDSYGHYPTTTENWIDNLASLIPNTVYKAEVGGASFGGTIPFTSVLQGIESTIPDPNKIGTIIVAGGYNDTTHISDIASGMSTFASYVSTQYPNAKIIVFYVALTTEATRNDTNLKSVLPYYMAYAPVYNNMSFAYGSHRILRDYSHLDSGGVHPNTYGARDIAFAIKNYLVSGTIISTFSSKDQHISDSGPNTSAYTNKILRVMPEGDTLTCWITSTFNLEFATSQSPTLIEIGTLTDQGFINGTYEPYCRANVPCSVYTNGGWLDGSGILSFNNGKVYFTCTTFRSNAIDGLYIPSCTFTLPLRWS